MWLSSSSVGRKFIMAVTGAALVLFVTFHCLLNAIAICWPATYNSVCEFLGANWYALIASVALAALIVIHIIYAVMLTMKNRKARGAQRYSVSHRPATVEWSSNNMLVLGIVILAFLVVHLIQFWARMQLQEIRGVEEALPPAAGTLFLQEAFELPWTAIVYIIGFVALWFHLQHGIWSMFQSVGWDSTVWIQRLKKVACWWATIVVLCFIAQAIVFTIKAHEGYYRNDPELRAQYVDMMWAMHEKDFGPDAAQVAPNVGAPYDEFAQDLVDKAYMINAQMSMVDDQAFEQSLKQGIEEAKLTGMSEQDIEREVKNARSQRERFKKIGSDLQQMRELVDYLQGTDTIRPNPQLVQQIEAQKMQMMLQQQQQTQTQRPY